MRNWYNNLSDPVKAALRTFKQSVIGGIAASLLLLSTTALNFFNNQPVDLYGDLSNAGKAFGIIIMGAIISLVTFADNKWGRGPSATYPEEN